MTHAALDRATLHQRAAKFTVLLRLVGEGIGDRVRHHDRGGKMDDGIDPVFAINAATGSGRGLADDEWCGFR